MKFNYSPAPNYRAATSTGRIMFELMIGLIIVYLASLFFYATSYGMDYMLQAILLMAAALGGCVGTEIVWAIATKVNVLSFLKGSFPWITGMILGLMIPINMHWYAVLVAAILCTLFSKLFFGGFGQNIFNPAAVGRAITLAAFAGMTTDVVTEATPISLIASNNWCITDASMVSELLNKVGGLGGMLLNPVPGTIGEVNALIILFVGVVLAIRKVIDWRIPVVFVSGVFVITAVMAMYKGMGMWYPIFHVLTNSLLFGAVFMATDPVTTPTSAAGKVIYAMGCAIITVLIRVKANLPDGVLYSILIMNVCTPMIERVCDCEQLHGLRKSIVTFICVTVLGIGSGVIAISAVEPAQKPKPQPKPVVTVDETNEHVQKFTAVVNNTLQNSDGSVTYSISCEGYAVYNYDDGEPNEFDITIQDGAVVSVVVTKAADTEYVGDKIKQESFTSQFVGKTQEDFSIEAISSSTISCASAYKAVLTALEQ